jgi:hypothetical protein
MQWIATLRPFFLTKKETTYWKTVLRARYLGVALVMMIVGHFVSDFWVFRMLSEAGRGALIYGAAKRPAIHVQVVEIDRQDYHDFFGEESPLDPQRLAVLIQALIATRPAAIVVDIDTSSAKFKGMPLSQVDVPIVWAREMSTDLKLPSKLTECREPEWEDGGYVDYQPGLTGYLDDFPRGVRKEDHCLPTIHWAAVKAYCAKETVPETCEHAKSDGPLAVTMRQVQTLYARDFLESRNGIIGVKSTGNAEELLGGKLLFLGGSYSNSDFYRSYTTSTSVEGVKLLAMAAEAELDGQRLGELPWIATKLLEIMLSLLLAAVYYYLRPLPATLFSLSLLSLSIIYVGYLGYLAHVSVDFIPFLIAIWLELMVHGAEECETPSETARSASKS